MSTTVKQLWSLHTIKQRGCAKVLPQTQVGDPGRPEAEKAGARERTPWASIRWSWRMLLGISAGRAGKGARVSS